MVPTVNRQQGLITLLTAIASLLWMLPQSAIAAITPVITSVSSPIFVGDSFTINGSGFTAGSKVNFFVAVGGGGALNFGPLTPSGHTTTTLTVPVPSTVTTLGQGVVSLVVINTDQGFTFSDSATAQLFGDPALGFPNLFKINGVGLAATSTNPSFSTDNVETAVIQTHTVTLAGSGFDTIHGVAVDLFCDCSGGKITPLFLNPGNPGLTPSSLSFILPSGAVTGPGSFVISNKGAKGDYAIKSNAVSVSIGAPVSVTSVTQAPSSCTVTVKGTGFAVTGGGLPPFTVINLFNSNGSSVVNLGGLGPGGPRIPLNVTSGTQFTFSLSGTGFTPGGAYVEVFNPPFVPFSSSGSTPNGAFKAAACTAATPTPRPTSTHTPPGPTPTPGPTPVIPNINQYRPAME
jgi:hypothetical protein